MKEKGQVFGQSCTGLLAKYDQNTHSLKTFQLSLFEEEPESLETLPKSGMTVNGKLWEQTMWAHPTGGRGSGLWPTPIVGDSHLSSTEEVARHRITEGKVTLSRAVQSKMWPTPRASEWKDVGPVGSKSHTHMDKRDYLCAKVKDPEQPTGSLNPQWEEWLMGYPIGWTA